MLLVGRLVIDMARIKDCFCHTCGLAFHHLGIAGHRAMHRDKRTDCKVTQSDGDTVIYRFSMMAVKQIDEWEEGNEN